MITAAIDRRPNQEPDPLARDQHALRPSRLRDEPRTQGFFRTSMTGMFASMDDVDRHLVAILHSRPNGSGAITKARVELVRHSLQCSTATITNIFDAELPHSGALSQSRDFDAWARARLEIVEHLDAARSSDVLLAYGTSPPSGPHLKSYRDQIDWLRSTLDARQLRVWTVGHRPTHPSRWQRVTSRKAPGLLMDAAVQSLLTQQLGSRLHA